MLLPPSKLPNLQSDSALVGAPVNPASTLSSHSFPENLYTQETSEATVIHNPSINSPKILTNTHSNSILDNHNSAAFSEGPSNSNLAKQTPNHTFSDPKPSSSIQTIIPSTIPSVDQPVDKQHIQSGPDINLDHNLPLPAQVSLGVSSTVITKQSLTTPNPNTITIPDDKEESMMEIEFHSSLPVTVLLEKGVRHQVGTEQSIRIWDHQWLP